MNKLLNGNILKTVEESVLTAMDCKDKEILPYLPYILQDFWEIGSDPDIMVNFIKKNFENLYNLKVLDLGCGKGAVSINIAKQLNCFCYGIDAIPEFVSYSVLKAEEYGVGDLCRFEVGDVREKIKTLAKYDIIILGAIGQVFGNYFETLTLLKNNLNKDGIIIIDDGHIDDASKFKHENIFTKSVLIRQIENAGMQIIDEVVATEQNSVLANYDKEYENIIKRCNELVEKHPYNAEIFMNYCNQQKNEYYNLKNEIICSTMVVKKIE